MNLLNSAFDPAREADHALAVSPETWARIDAGSHQSLITLR
jgi:hypothetical protein